MHARTLCLPVTLTGCLGIQHRRLDDFAEAQFNALVET